MGQTKEAIIAAEQQLSKEKLALENFNFDITYEPIFAKS
jgi:hypothetical protein